MVLNRSSLLSATSRRLSAAKRWTPLPKPRSLRSANGSISTPGIRFSAPIRLLTFWIIPSKALRKPRSVKAAAWMKASPTTLAPTLILFSPTVMKWTASATKPAARVMKLKLRSTAARKPSDSTAASPKSLPIRSSSGARRTAIRLLMPRTTAPMVESASLAASILAASTSETARPKASASRVARRRTAPPSSSRLNSRPCSLPSCAMITACCWASRVRSFIRVAMACRRWSSGRAEISRADSPSVFSASTAGPVPRAASPRRRFMFVIASRTSPNSLPERVSARSTTASDPAVVPSCRASLAWASIAARDCLVSAVPIAAPVAVTPAATWAARFTTLPICRLKVLSRLCARSRPRSRPTVLAVISATREATAAAYFARGTRSAAIIRLVTAL